MLSNHGAGTKPFIHTNLQLANSSLYIAQFLGVQPMSVMLPLELFRLPPKLPPRSSAPTAVAAAAVVACEGTAADAAPAAAAGAGANGADISEPGSIPTVPLPTMRHSRSLAQSSLWKDDSIAAVMIVHNREWPRTQQC